ncbi:MAG: hypothetical protein PF450_12135, partial [Bacteroidales bacterium]|nr:hypothetical protein [Bacteroidales bacterium]
MKPGCQLINLGIDESSFGGLTEIYGLQEDLKEMGFNVVLNEVEDKSDVVFVFSSGADCVLSQCMTKNCECPIIICASSAKSVGKTAPSPSLSFQFAVHQKHNTKRCLIFDDG